jgi:hypothetical protein
MAEFFRLALVAAMKCEPKAIAKTLLSQAQNERARFIRLTALLVETIIADYRRKFPRKEVSKRVAEPEGFEPSIGLYNPITV